VEIWKGHGFRLALACNDHRPLFATRIAKFSNALKGVGGGVGGWETDVNGANSLDAEAGFNVSRSFKL
jgi:hypothetical protein